MKTKFNIAVAVYLLSFFLPVLQYTLFTDEITIYGWEAGIDVLLNQNNGYSISDNTILIMFQYVVMNLANPLILAVIIMHYSNSSKKQLKWLLGTLAMLSAASYMPFMFTMLYTYFSLGYYAWFISIILIYFFSNEGSFKKPAKVL